MTRALFGPIGLVMALVPQHVLRWYERIALEEPDACEARPWVVSAIRAEGLVYLLVALVGGRASSVLKSVVGGVSLVALLFPRRYLDTGHALVYENSDDVTPNDGIESVVRGLGIALLVVMIVETLRSRQRR